MLAEHCSAHGDEVQRALPVARAGVHGQEVRDENRVLGGQAGRLS